MTQESLEGHTARIAAERAEKAELQAGMDNDALLAAWEKKLPGVKPSQRELTAFALGAEVGFEVCRSKNAQEWDRLHHVLKDAGVHPGRTDDLLADVVAKALKERQATKPAQETPNQTARIEKLEGLLQRAVVYISHSVACLDRDNSTNCLRCEIRAALEGK